jgi:hypothetical protein
VKQKWNEKEKEIERKTTKSFQGATRTKKDLAREPITNKIKEIPCTQPQAQERSKPNNTLIKSKVG